MREIKEIADYRAAAREVLQGKWKLAALTGMVAYMLGGCLLGFSSGRINIDEDLTEILAQTDFWVKYSAIILLLVGVWNLIVFIVSGAAKLGYATFNMKLVDGQAPAFADLFSQRRRLVKGFFMEILMGLFLVLWYLLLVIPGIIKSFSYAMTPYILAENPGMSPKAAITESRRIMNGRKKDLFWLKFSFIGWDILCALPFFIGFFGWLWMLEMELSVAAWAVMAVGLLLSFAMGLFVTPYQETAHAVFYRDALREAAQNPEEDAEAEPVPQPEQIAQPEETL